MFTTLEIQLEGPVATIWMNRPDLHNAFDETLITELTASDTLADPERCADRHRPDIGIVLTDLDGPARWRPAWPVIWAVPEAYATASAPFGRKLVLA